MDNICIFVILLAGFVSVSGTRDNLIRTEVSRQDVLLLLNETTVVDLKISGQHLKPFSIRLLPRHSGLIEIQSNPIVVNVSNKNHESHHNITLTGIHPGYLDVQSYVNHTNIEVEPFFLRVTVAISPFLIYLSQAVGWSYFLLWSVSYLPQIYDNYERKSVVGLNFDYLAFNTFGTAMYALFNSGLYWSETIQNEYFERFPTGLNPVLLNDVLFSLIFLVSTVFTVLQCFRYESAGQRVSNTARSILSMFCSIIVILSVLQLTIGLSWLDFMYYCSYIKLTITLIKYVPQAYMNYLRKSTEGWAIGCIILDLFGGVFSIMQMVINAYNYDDWISIFGDPTKFGLGMFSVLFDLFFMAQHYIWYRKHPANGLEKRDDNFNGIYAEIATCSVNSEKKLLPSNEMDL